MKASPPVSFSEAKDLAAARTDSRDVRDGFPADRQSLASGAHFAGRADLEQGQVPPPDISIACPESDRRAMLKPIPSQVGQGPVRAVEGEDPGVIR